MTSQAVHASGPTTDDAPDDTRPWTTAAPGPFGVLITATGPGVPVTAVPVPWLRDLTRRHHLVALRGFTAPADATELDAYARTWGEVMEWPFGTVFDVRAHQDPEDHVFDTGFMPLHWDGMYVDFVPEFQVFHCVAAPGAAEGGGTLFCDTTRVLADADEETLERWRGLTLRYRNAKVSHYGGLVVSPLIEPHPDAGFPVMRFLEPVPDGEHIINQPDVHVDGLEGEAATAELAAIRDAAYDPRHVYVHAWQQDDIVIADNYTLLHTRVPYRRGLPRHLRRVHVLGEPPLPSHIHDHRDATGADTQRGTA
ncbi:TauD/TfdA dioxygenase family protein [Streptomyces chrestomyceticus]|uniref:TauD/TfdA dioxygenase family protein n=1 Tax=Streptomyces chrestomyceticus TaxID=68185 RepID=UPI0037A028DF